MSIHRKNEVEFMIRIINLNVQFNVFIRLMYETSEIVTKDLNEELIFLIKQDCSYMLALILVGNLFFR